MANFNKEIKYPVVIFLFSFTLYLMFLGNTLLWDTDEALYTRIAKEMSITGDYLTTQWNFEPWFCHPPLYFWLTVLSAHFLGWTEFVARFPSALFGVFNTVIIYFLGKLLFNEKVGFYSSIIFTLSLQIWIQARMAILDMPFLFFIIAATYFFLRGIYLENHRWFTGFWICAGFAVLAKGPVGIILPVIYALFYSIAGKKLKEFICLFLSPGIMLFMLIAIPWYWGMISVYGGQFIEKVFGYFFLGRITSPVMEQGGAWHYYFPILLAGFLPWTPFLPLVFYALFKNLKNYRVFFLSLWITCTFLMFSIFKTKLPNYILFIYPALSITLGWVLKEVFEGKKYQKAFIASVVCFFISIFIVIAAFKIMVIRTYSGYLEQYGNLLTPIGIVLVLGGFTTFTLSFLKKEYAFQCIIVTATAFYFFLSYLYPLTENFRAELVMISTIKQQRKTGDRLAMRRNFGASCSILYYTDMPGVFFESNEALMDGINKLKNIFITMNRSEFARFKHKITVPINIIHTERSLILFYVKDPDRGIKKID